MATFRPLPVPPSRYRSRPRPTETRGACRHGHPSTPATVYRDREGHLRCRVCALEAMRAFRRRNGVSERGWLQRAILAALRTHPEGLRADRLRAKIGYRASAPSLRSAVCLLRRRGVPVVGVREGNRVRYVLREDA